MRLKALLVLTAVLSISTTIPVFANGWQENDQGWWYDRGNGTKFSNSWQWIDGNGDGVAECYYLDGSGYCLSDTVTPDGYMVNADGAWVIDGIIQTKSDNSASLRSYTGYVDDEPLSLLGKERTEVENLYPDGIPYSIYWGRESDDKQYAWDVSGDVNQILKTDNVEEIISYYKNQGWSAYKIKTGGAVNYHDYWLKPPSGTPNDERIEIKIGNNEVSISRNYAGYTNKEEL